MVEQTTVPSGFLLLPNHWNAPTIEARDSAEMPGMMLLGHVACGMCGDARVPRLLL